MTDKNNIGVKVVSHNSKTELWCKEAYLKVVTIVIPQIISSWEINLTAISTHCEQLIKYECSESFIFRLKYCWWVSRDEDQMTYWEGRNSNYPY